MNLIHVFLKMHSTEVEIEFNLWFRPFLRAAEEGPLRRGRDPRRHQRPGARLRTRRDRGQPGLPLRPLQGARRLQGSRPRHTRLAVSGGQRSSQTKEGQSGRVDSVRNCENGQRVNLGSAGFMDQTWKCKSWISILPRWGWVQGTACTAWIDRVDVALEMEKSPNGPPRPGQCGRFGPLFHFQCDIHPIHTVM